MESRSETISLRDSWTRRSAGHCPSRLSTLATILATLGAFDAEPGDGCVTSTPTTIVLSSSMIPSCLFSTTWLMPPSLRLNLSATLAKYCGCAFANFEPTTQTVWMPSKTSPRYFIQLYMGVSLYGRIMRTSFARLEAFLSATSICLSSGVWTSMRDPGIGLSALMPTFLKALWNSATVDCRPAG